MGIEGIEEIKEGAEEIVTPETEIEVAHASDQHGLPDAAVTDGVVDAEGNVETVEAPVPTTSPDVIIAEPEDEVEDVAVTENPGAAPADVEQVDDGTTAVEVVPGEPVEIITGDEDSEDA